MKKICKLHKHERDHKHLHKSINKPDLGKAETGYEKGVHTAISPGNPGISRAGLTARDAKQNPEGLGNQLYAEARGDTRKVIREARSMSKPKLGKSCEFHKAELAKHTCALHKSEEGVHNGAEDKENKKGSNPDNEDQRHDDCQYCQDLDAVENANGTAGMGDNDGCPMCQEMDSTQGDNHSDCPYCQEMDGGQEGTATEDDCPYCESEVIEQANPENEQAVSADDADPSTNSPDNCPECQKMYGDAVEEQPGQTGQEPPKTQGHETAEEVLDMLDQEPGTGEPPAEEAKQIDNTELPQGDAMEEGTSVPENFGDAQKGDVSDEEAAFGGDDQDEPDMASVMQGGLDDHANEQKRQQVLDMVGQTLAGFKANKASLEATKEQNMPLYQSCIQMLKSMISLCELLGLKPQTQEQPGQEQPGQEMPPEQSAPIAPGHSPGAPPKEAAEGQPDPKAEG